MPTKKQHQAKIDKLLAIVEQNFQHSEKTNFLEYTQKFLNSKLLTKKSIKVDFRICERFFVDTFKNKYIENIKHTDIAKLFNKVSHDNGKVMANRIYALLHSIFEAAILDDLIFKNPCKKIKRHKELSRTRFLNKEELARFLIATSLLDPKYKCFFLLLLFTGARNGSVKAMRWENVDLNAGKWATISKKGKGTKAIIVFLNSHSIACLEEMRKISGKSTFVFPANSQSGHMEEPKKIWTKLCKNIGLKDFTMHDLRATFATWQKNLGSPINIVSNSLHHSGVEITKVYLRDNSQDIEKVRNSVNMVGEKFMAIYEERKKEIEDTEKARESLH